MDSTFWNTVRWGNSAKLWNIIEVSRSAGGRSVTSLPAMKILPSVVSNWCRQILQDQKVRSRRLGLQDPCELAHQVAEHNAKYDRDDGDEGGLWSAAVSLSKCFPSNV
jgi:hypothetical protein